MSAPQYDPKRAPKLPTDPDAKKKKYPLSDDSERAKKQRDRDHDRDPDEQRDSDDEHRMLGGEA